MPVLVSRGGAVRVGAAAVVALSLTVLAACRGSDPPAATGAESTTTSVPPAPTSGAAASTSATAGITTTSAPPPDGGTAAEAWRLVIEAPVSNGTTSWPLTLCYAATGPTREATLSLAVSTVAVPGGERSRAEVDIAPGRGAAVVDLGLEGDQVLDLEVRLRVGGEATDTVVSITAVAVRDDVAATSCA